MRDQKPNKYPLRWFRDPRHAWIADVILLVDFWLLCGMLGYLIGASMC